MFNVEHWPEVSESCGGNNSNNLPSVNDNIDRFDDDLAISDHSRLLINQDYSDLYYANLQAVIVNQEYSYILNAKQLEYSRLVSSIQFYTLNFSNKGTVDAKVLEDFLEKTKKDFSEQMVPMQNSLNQSMAVQREILGKLNDHEKLHHASRDNQLR